MADEGQSLPPPLRIPSISIWRVLVFLVRDFGFYLVVGAVLGALVGGILLGGAGVLLGSQLSETWTTSSGTLSKIAGYAVLVLVALAYTAAGVAQGFLFSIISFLLGKTDMVEKELHEFLEPISQNLVARIPFGQEGIPVESFVEVFDPILKKLYVDARPKGFSILFAGNAAVRFAFRLVIRAVRWAVDEFFVEELQEEGVTRVNMTQMERFMRETLTDLVLDRYTLQLKWVRRLIIIFGIVLVLVALGVSGILAF